MEPDRPNGLLEAAAPQPFRSPFDAVKRLFWEPWITFPRFVLSGQWSAARKVKAEAA